MGILSFCTACGGSHEPDPPTSWVEFRGYRFSPPFYCMCCGKVICARQFAYGRCCGPCDTGSCTNGMYTFRLPKKQHTHPLPPWSRGLFNSQDFLGFVEYCKATPAIPLHLDVAKQLLEKTKTILP
jgi:hypothetical protein